MITEGSVEMEERSRVSRAKRVATDSEILYSEIARVDWHAGMVKNVSSSGLLFVGKHPVRLGEPVEMTFVVPDEIRDERARVYCTAVIVRTDADPSGGTAVQMGASITHWQRLPAENGLL
jgi:hypothetical protein